MLRGERNGWHSYLAFAGPAVIASIAYVDPGNFATNIQAGAKFGYGLLWVVLLANVIAMLFQALSAKLGIVTGRNLAEICRDEFSKPVVLAMWVVSEIAAMATDLAEFLGGAIGLSLLFHLPLFAGMIVTAFATFGLLMFQNFGFRPIELIIASMVSVIALCYLVEVFIVPIDWVSAAVHTVVPHIADAAGAAAGGRHCRRDRHAARRLSAFGSDAGADAGTRRWRAAKACALLQSGSHYCADRRRTSQHGDGDDGLKRLSRWSSGSRRNRNAYHTLTPLFGVGAAAVFLVSLIASGISASTVGTMAGQMIMQGFVGFRIPIWLRRLVTMLPAIVVVGIGVNATNAMVVSQVVLSIALPLPMIALIIFTGRRDIMGTFANRRVTQLAATAGAVIVIVLNLFLIAQLTGVPIPGLSGRPSPPRDPRAGRK